MGKIRVTKAGYLYFDFYYNGVRCREYTEMKNTPKNMKLMQEAMQKIESEIRLGTFEYARYFPDSKMVQRFQSEVKSVKGISFEEFTNKWYKTNSISWKPSVKRDFSSIIKCHLIPYFKDKAIQDITKTMVKEFRASLGQLQGRKSNTLSNKRINNIIQVLKLIMNDASDEMEINNPVTNLKPLSVKKADVMPFSMDEVLEFIEKVNPNYRNYYIVRFFTGMRTAEIDGLKWKYVDFKNKKIMVRETWQNGQWVTPKTNSSVRDIDMSKIVFDALLEQQKVTGKYELVFCTKKGKPFDYNNITKRIWYPTLKSLGLTPRNPYQTRHTAATLWLASGENPEWVARQLGHANTEMLFKVYSRFIPNLTRRDGSAFEEMLKRKLDEVSGKNEDENE